MNTFLNLPYLEKLQHFPAQAWHLTTLWCRTIQMKLFHSAYDIGVHYFVHKFIISEQCLQKMA